MGSKRKKRTKRYNGEDAKHLQAPVSEEPVVRRFTAVDRPPLQQWWFEKKRIVKIVSIIVAVATLVIWSVYELFTAVL